VNAPVSDAAIAHGLSDAEGREHETNRYEGGVALYCTVHRLVRNEHPTLLGCRVCYQIIKSVIR
jgi:hypothetical protein